MTVDGLITVSARQSVEETIPLVERALAEKGMRVFARIDHAANAREAGLTLRPTFLLIFGNAKGGTPLMVANQTIGIDLPLKLLVWQDEAGKAWLSYNDPAWVARRHGLGTNVPPVVAMAALLAEIATIAGA